MLVDCWTENVVVNAGLDGRVDNGSHERKHTRKSERLVADGHSECPFRKLLYELGIDGVLDQIARGFIDGLDDLFVRATSLVPEASSPGDGGAANGFPSRCRDQCVNL